MNLSLCFIASHCRAGRLQPSSLLLMAVGVLFLLQIYAWAWRRDLRSLDTVSAARETKEADCGSPCVFQVSLRSST